MPLNILKKSDNCTKFKNMFVFKSVFTKKCRDISCIASVLFIRLPNKRCYNNDTSVRTILQQQLILDYFTDLADK